VQLEKTQLKPPSKLQILSPITNEPHQNALANVKSVHHFNKNHKTISIVGLVKCLTNHPMLALKLIFMFFAKTFTTSTTYVVFEHEIKAMINNIHLVSLIQ